MELALIALVAKNLGIGKDNKLLMRISQDMKRFRSLTLNHPIIMGRKTFESLGKPLDNRANIVLSRQPLSSQEGLYHAHNIEEALNISKNLTSSRAYVIGGSQIYNQTINLADRLELTEIKSDFEADTFFPEL